MKTNHFLFRIIENNKSRKIKILKKNKIYKYIIKIIIKIIIKYVKNERLDWNFN